MASAVRMRHLTRVDVPISQQFGNKLIAWNETFYALNRTDWSGKPGLALMLNFVGLGVPLTKSITAESGYLNFRTFGPGVIQVRHIAAACVSVRL